MDLFNHENREDLIQMAFSYQRGKAQGEFMRETNHEYQRQVKASADAVNKAKK